MLNKCSNITVKGDFRCISINCPGHIIVFTKCFCFSSKALTNSKHCLVEAAERLGLLAKVPCLHSAADITSSVALIVSRSAEITHRLKPWGSLPKTPHCYGFSDRNVVRPPLDFYKRVEHACSIHVSKQPLSRLQLLRE